MTINAQNDDGLPKVNHSGDCWLTRPVVWHKPIGTHESQGNMAKILIIDDDWQIHQLVGGFLRRHGHEVNAASNGGQGLIMAAAFTPDLILCDLDMPGVNGQGLVSALRQDEMLGEIPVVFLSGCTERKEIRKSMNLGGDDFITKPAELPEILETINARLTRLSQQRQRKDHHINQAADFIVGIINNLGHSGSADIKWWSEAGESSLEPPNPIIQRVRQILIKKMPANKGEVNPQVGKSALLVKDDNRRQYLHLSEVKAFMANGEYSTVCWGNDRHMLFRKALKQWSQELPTEQFVRVHRSAIINLAFLDFVERDAEGKQHVHLKEFKEVIPVSQRAKSLFNRTLKNFRPQKG